VKIDAREVVAQVARISGDWISLQVIESRVI